MRLTYLNFDDRLNRTICAFNDDTESLAFIRAFTEEEYAALPQVHPVHTPIPTFTTAREAIRYYKTRGFRASGLA